MGFRVWDIGFRALGLGFRNRVPFSVSVCQHPLITWLGVEIGSGLILQDKAFLQASYAQIKPLCRCAEKPEDVCSCTPNAYLPEVPLRASLNHHAGQLSILLVTFPKGPST